MGAAGVKSIAVSTATRYWLDELKKDGETYSDVIDRLIDNYEMTRDKEKPDNPVGRIEAARQIQEIIDNPDRYYNDEEEPTDRLKDYLLRTACPTPFTSLLPSPQHRKDVTRLMTRYWSTREALDLITDLYGGVVE